MLKKSTRYEVVTFDCYGTLIDWEAGIKSAFSHSLGTLGLSQAQESMVFDLYGEEEKRLEGEKEYRSYRLVLSEAASAVAQRLNLDIPAHLSTFLAEQLPHWNPFPDTNIALERLVNSHRLGILSNVDDDLLAGTLTHFTVPFDIVVTAEQVRSYKPGVKHFEKARKMIGNRKWLHVAASLYHDIEPASKLGIPTLWVNRKKSSEGREYEGSIFGEVESLTQLADLLAV